MNGKGTAKGWTDDQWSRVQQAVHDEAQKARVAGRFLPLFGPLPGDVATVPAHLVALKERDRKKQSQPGQSQAQPNQTDVKKRLAIDDIDVLPLITVAVNVFVTATQHADPELSSALTLFRRAANVIAKIEDAIIFSGEKWDQAAQKVLYAATTTPINEVVDISPDPLPSDLRSLLRTGIKLPNTRTLRVDGADKRGQGLVTLVAEGISDLDARGFQGPYALVLSQNLFVDAETPNEKSLVLPSDRIQPLLEGPLLRSTVLPVNEGVLVSLAGNPIEIVVANEIHVRFLQLTTETLHAYRVSEKFVLRIKEPGAVLTLKLLDTTSAKDHQAEAAKYRAAAEAHSAAHGKAADAVKKHQAAAAEHEKTATRHETPTNDPAQTGSSTLEEGPQ